MIQKNLLTAEQLRREGLHALHARLGVAGAVRFLREFSQGYGDYTAERGSWLDDWPVDEITAAIREAETASEVEPLLSSRAALHKRLAALTTWYADATSSNQHMVRELAAFITERFGQQPEAVSPLPKAPEGYSIAFVPDRFVTLELRKRKAGVKLRLSGDLESLRRHGAPEGLRAVEGRGFVRVDLDDLSQMKLARQWIIAAAAARKVTARERH